MLFFCLFQYFEEKEYQTESKRNETFGSVIFGTNVIQRTWSASQEAAKAATRVEGAHPYRARPLSRGPLGQPPTYFFLLYKPTYPENIQGATKNTFSAAASFCSSVIPSRGLFRYSAGGEIDHGGFLHHPCCLPMMHE